MASFTQFIDTQRTAYHGRQIKPSTPETALNAAYGKQNWSARLIDSVHWGLYIWHPFTPSDPEHGMWRMERSARVASYIEAVGVFARAAENLRCAETDDEFDAAVIGDNSLAY